ncbi:hypothetical protein BDP27DRAFT_1424394 [Rhodocollybia butyracea]|uniref:Uncharacterized protein n=1 Tax=Rhodocollybia butyracea TaxID=206335 RepID=A0A9P5U4P6_9AGAR|nr:hypothetical protein BDP27DRAFT_1424394 [Rhodocollybia butyracea]
MSSQATSGKAKSSVTKAKSTPKKATPKKPSSYDLHPTYLAKIPGFFDCKSPMQQALTGIIITYLQENRRYEQLEAFAKCDDPRKQAWYKHMLATSMGQARPTEFANMALAVSHVVPIRPDTDEANFQRLCEHAACGDPRDHPIFQWCQKDRLELFRQYCHWLMLCNETTKLKQMRNCLPHIGSPAAQYRTLEVEIETFLEGAQADSTSPCALKRKRDSSKGRPTPSKQRKLDSSNAINSRATPSTTPPETQPFPLTDDDSEIEIEFVDNPQASSAPEAGPSSLAKSAAEAGNSSDVESMWIDYLSRACEDLEKAVQGDKMQDKDLRPKLLALAQTIYECC